MPLTNYERLFGAGPRGIVITLATLGIAAAAADRMGPWPVHGKPAIGWAALGVSLVSTLAVAGWALRSLPPADRGKALITNGAFRYFRHPLYASFLTFFDFGLALYVDHWVFIVWAVAQHPIWHWYLLHEERLMRREFGAEYEAYCAQTGRLVPRFWRRHSPG